MACGRCLSPSLTKTGTAASLRRSSELLQKVDAAIKVADERRAFARAAVLAAEFWRRVARFEAAKKSDFNFFVALADTYKHKSNGTWVVRMRDA